MTCPRLPPFSRRTEISVRRKISLTQWLDVFLTPFGILSSLSITLLFFSQTLLHSQRWSKLSFTSQYRCIFNPTNRWYEKIYVLYEICLIIFFSYNKWMFDRLCVYRRTCHPNKENELRLKGELNTLTPKISLVILLIVCQTILIMLVWRIWYRIN